MNSKAFEFALVEEISRIASLYTAVEVYEGGAYENYHRAYSDCLDTEKERLRQSAMLVVDALFRMEPVICHPSRKDDVLRFDFLPGIVDGTPGARNVILSRRDLFGKPFWKIGISSCDGHEIIRHQKFSTKQPLWKDWLSLTASESYTTVEKAIFEKIETLSNEGVKSWRQMGARKETEIIAPLSQVLQRALLESFTKRSRIISRRIISSILGSQPFYRIVRQNKNAPIVLKAIALSAGLGSPFNGFRPDCVPDRLPLPTRLIEINPVGKSESGRFSILLDRGWRVDFKLHTASARLKACFVLDIQIVEMPSKVFTLHLF